jgi:hypothetical protein
MTAPWIAWDGFGLVQCSSTSAPRLSNSCFGFDYVGPEPEGVLYRYDPDGSVHIMIERLSIPNGTISIVITNPEASDGMTLSGVR